MMKTFENKIIKIKLLKGIFASMTMYQQKQQKLLEASTNKIKTVDQQAQAKKKESLFRQSICSYFWIGICHGKSI